MPRYYVIANRSLTVVKTQEACFSFEAESEEDAARLAESFLKHDHSERSAVLKGIITLDRVNPKHLIDWETVDQTEVKIEPSVLKDVRPLLEDQPELKTE